MVFNMNFQKSSKEACIQLLFDHFYLILNCGSAFGEFKRLFDVAVLATQPDGSQSNLKDG